MANNIMNKEDVDDMFQRVADKLNEDNKYLVPLKSVSKEELKEMFPDLREAGKLMSEAPFDAENRMAYLPKEID